MLERGSGVPLVLLSLFVDGREVNHRIVDFGGGVSSTGFGLESLVHLCTALAPSPWSSSWRRLLSFRPVTPGETTALSDEVSRSRQRGPSPPASWTGLPRHGGPGPPRRATGPRRGAPDKPAPGESVRSDQQDCRSPAETGGRRSAPPRQSLASAGAQRPAHRPWRRGQAGPSPGSAGRFGPALRGCVRRSFAPSCLA